MKKPFLQKIRTVGINWTASAMNWNDKLFAPVNFSSDKIMWRDHVRWFIDRKLSMVFGWFWSGSDEEIEAVWLGEVPVGAMSARQLSELTDESVVECIRCQAAFVMCDSLLENGDCPECGGNLYLIGEDQKKEVAS